MEHFGEGIIEPPIIKQLRVILDQYPDDGQILKELIQNAEDAGATEVKFLYDETQYGQETLCSPELASFQGPALYAYNNAKFMEKDWVGLRMLQDSVKEKEPLKVGRFGLGFKSVYHLTDLPSVFSDALIGFIDPHAKFVKKDKQTPCWYLGKHSEEIVKLEDQFKPFKHALFGITEDTFASKKYQNTLFRFPLRSKASELSDVIYNEEKIDLLYQSFESEAHCILLFLKSLEKVELYHQRRDSPPHLRFRVQIAPACLDEVRRERLNFMKQIQQNKTHASCSYKFTTETTKYQDGEEVCETKSWIVCHRYGRAEARTKGLADELHLLPWVAVAQCVDSGTCQHPQRGHLFSFLPLPQEEESPTGLPYHVHGYFALEQNRRHLKWPSAEQDRKKLTDKSIRWNLHLVENLVPVAMAQLVQYLRSNKLPSQMVYNAIPNIAEVKIQWHGVLQPYFKDLLGGNICYTPNNGGQWVSLRQALLEDNAMDPNLRNHVNELLISDQVARNVVSLPEHLLNAIQKFQKKVKLSCVSPKIVRDALRIGMTWHDIQDEGKHLLLDYITRDEKYEELLGLQLLPLADGTFDKFAKPNSGKKIFVESAEHPKTIIPQSDGHFVPTQITTRLQHTLESIANAGATQVTMLKPADVPYLLHEVTPGEWRGQNRIEWSKATHVQFPEPWFKYIWKYITYWFSDSLQRFHGLHLLDLRESSSDGPRFLAKLGSSIPLMLRAGGSWSMSQSASESLKKLGIVILDALPQYVKQHQDIETYILSPSSAGLQKALCQLKEVYGIEHLQRAVEMDLNMGGRTDLCHMLIGGEITEECKYILQRLPFFNAGGRRGEGIKLVSASEVPMGVEELTLPVPLPEEVMLLSDKEDRELALTLGVEILTEVQQVTNLIFPAMKDQRGFLYSKEDVQELMLSLLGDFKRFEGQSDLFVKQMKSLKFVPNAAGEPGKPNERADPSSEILVDLLEGQNVFPCGAYLSGGILNALRKLGMKTLGDIKPKVVMSVAKKLDTTDVVSEKGIKMSNALMKLLEQRTELLETCIEGETLAVRLSNMAWIMPSADPPDSYPPGMHWAGRLAQLQKPADLKAMKYALICGSVKPVISEGYPDALIQAFGWNKTPHLNDLIAHLKHAIESYTPQDKPLYMRMILDIYKALGHTEGEAILAAVQHYGVRRWIWHGEGFASPDELVFKQPYTDLRPHIYSVPQELQAHKGLLFKIGVKSKCNLVEVLEKIKNSHVQCPQCSEHVFRDVKLAIDILNELSRHSQYFEECIKDQILVPLYTEDDNFRMAPVEQCTYCEGEWMQDEGILSDLKEEEDILIVHPDLPGRTASRLQIPNLMNRFLDAEELDISYGQSEPLTRRLKSILQEYTDGFAVPKELVQNADDAGATEVKILYDERENQDARTCLIDENMNSFQGPAIWAYNNAVFSDEDFQNIVKLSGATKENQTSKIGRFGLGFNAVYNLTDVPSFVSRHYVVIFDPHTTYLGKAIHNGNKPGIRLDLQKHKGRFVRLKNQFKPYNGIFGCDLSPSTQQMSYPGTLFRFPLRTREQAQSSQILKKHYDKAEVLELLKMFEASCNSLLLFTQNVVRVSLHHLPYDATDASHPTELISICKQPVKFIREISPTIPENKMSSTLVPSLRKLVQQSSILGEATRALTEDFDSSKSISSSYVVQVSTEVSEEFSELLPSVNVGNEECLWLVSAAMGKGKSLEMARDNSDLMPVGGAAVKLGKETLAPHIMGSTIHPDGHMYCFLPLPILSYLPVHLNGYFAVTSNRKHLCEKTLDDKTLHQAIWNEVLLEDAVCMAYISLLEDAKAVTNCAFDPMEVWPQVIPPGSLQRKLISSFYSKITGPDAPALFTDGKVWQCFDNTIFLDHDFRNSAVGDTALKILRQLLVETSQIVVDLPFCIYEKICDVNCGSLLDSKKYDNIKFFECLLPRLDDICHSEVDELIKYALLLGDKTLNKLLVKADCIPVAPEGNRYKKPGQLIHPKGKAAKLFSISDEKFPASQDDTSVSGRDYTDPSLMQALLQLGMAQDLLTWEEVIERAESVKTWETLSSRQQAAKDLMDYLEWRIQQKDVDDTKVEAQQKLRKTRFLPPKSRPANFDLPWEEQGHPDDCLLSPDQLFLENDSHLVCCTEPIADPNVVKYNHRHAVSFLGMKRSLTIAQVICQLERIMTSSETANPSTIDPLIESIYKFLEERCKEHDACEEISELLNEKYVWIDGKFIEAWKCAFMMPVQGMPYLCAVPANYYRKYPKFMEIIGVKYEMGHMDYVKALSTMHEQYDGIPLPGIQLSMAVRFVQAQCESMQKHGIDVDDLAEENIYVPDTEGILSIREELCYNNCTWMEPEQGQRFTHKDIAQSVISVLKIKTVREDALDKYSVGLPFGQHEKLTNRLNRILQGYPCDKEILKELVQNADDAGASEIHFIKDCRHHSENRIFEDCWKPLQGPALCVYNNQPFTQRDIEGIQNLGEGSKSSDPNKTGQYGVGFNCVYHLTDTPTFLSSGTDIGQILCAFDPHCCYVPGATPNNPGRMFNNTNSLKKRYPDVFIGYLEDHFSNENATMFRLPLRTAEQAGKGQVGKGAISLEALQCLLDKFQEEAKNLLLFLNHIENISIWEVKDDGKPVCMYWVKASCNASEKDMLNNYSKAVKTNAETMKKPIFKPTDIKCHTLLYNLQVKDSQGIDDGWVISRRLGFLQSDDIPGSVVHALQHGDLGTLPRGGVAILVSQEKPHSNPNNDKVADSVQNEHSLLYCFLPLPIRTQLPVHINGHFALDTESRRQLWPKERGGYQADWNSAILRQVVSPAYLELLKWMKNKVGRGKTDSSVTLEQYHKAFPCTTSKNHYLQLMATSLYKMIAHLDVPLLAMPTDGGLLEWYPPCGSVNVYFSNLHQHIKKSNACQQKGKPHKVVSSILRNYGFKLLSCPESLYLNFCKANIDVNLVSPEAVLEYWSSLEFEKFTGSLPQPISSTPFKNAENFALVFGYCCQKESDLEKLSGCPLLLTQDEMLHQFGSSSAKYLSQDYHLLAPECGNEFVHDCICKTLDYKLVKLCTKLGIIKKLGIKEFADLLPRRLPESYCQGNDVACKPWDPDNSPVTRQWLYNVWTFVRNCIEEQGNHQLLIVDEIQMRNLWQCLEPIQKCCLLPASRGSKLCLIQVGKANIALDLTLGSQLFAELKNILRKLAIMEPNYSVINGSMYQVGGSRSLANSALVHYLVATVERPGSTLVALQDALQHVDAHGLTPSEGRTLLQYFNDHLERIKDVPQGMQTLRDLPFHRTIKGKTVKLKNSSVYLVPPLFPTDDMDTFESTHGNVFLREDVGLAKLYEYLGCMKQTVAELYCGFVFVHFEMLSPEGRKKHLAFIKAWVKSCDKNSSEARALLAGLKKLHFLPGVDGELHCASEFMDPFNEVFKEMHPTSCFPPDPFSDIEWIVFMRLFGLQSLITDEMFIKYAREVEKEALTNSTEKTKRKSSALVENLSSRDDLESGTLLNKVAGIRFLAPQKLKGDLLLIHKGYGQRDDGSLPYHCYKGCVIARYWNVELLWTSFSLVSSSSLPICRDKVAKKLYSMLQVQDEVTVSQVIQNMKAVCTHQKEIRNERTNVGERSLQEVLQKNLEFLHKHLSDHDISKANLGNLPCILVEKGHGLVSPEQLVVNILPDDVIPGYLYKIPSGVAQFEELLCKIGTTGEATISQYGNVLTTIFSESRGKKLSPNEQKCVEKSTRGLFLKLKSGKDDCILKKLYLPTQDLCLMNSADIIFIDNPAFQNRLGSSCQNLPFLNSTICEPPDVLLEGILELLPKQLQPKKLTSVIKEKLVQTEQGQCSWSDLAMQLQARMTSKDFLESLLRLLKHIVHAQADQQDNLNTSIKCLESSLCGIEVKGVSHITTYLEYKERKIENSEEQKSFFSDLNKTSGKWVVYVAADGEQDGIFWTKVGQFINQITRDLFTQEKDILQIILTSPLAMMSQLLDKLDVRSDFSKNSLLRSGIPELGTPIPIDDHHLLQQTFEYFREEEYVGYEIADDHTKGPSCIVYARVLNQVEDGYQGVHNKRYLIQVDEKGSTREVSAIDLYKFHRKAVLVSGAMVLVGEPPSGLGDNDGETEMGKDSPAEDKYQDLEKVKKEITSILEETWHLPHGDRHKVHKRLILKWHPDKNLGHEHFAKEAFQHLQKEMKRLQKDGGPTKKETKTPGSASSSADRPFWDSYADEDDFWTYMNERAKEHRKQRRQYQENYARSENRQRDFYHDIPPSFTTKNPQPREARRWLRQAQENLNAAHADLIQVCNEWACCKLYQSAELALTAARFALDDFHPGTGSLQQLASGLGDCHLDDLARRMGDILGPTDSSRMCHPRVGDIYIPHEKFTCAQAERAQQVASDIVASAKEFIQDRWHNVGDL